MRQRVILMAFDMFEMNRGSQQEERINDLHFEVCFGQKEAARFNVLRFSGCVEAFKYISEY
jgi:hypothetical protein